MSVSRRDLLVAGSVASVGFPAISVAQSRQLRLGILTPVGHPWNRAALQVATRLNEETKGRLTLTVFHSGQLGNESAMLQQMQTIGLRRIAIVHQNDGFGKNSLQIALNAFAANDLKAAATLAVEASGSNTPDLARQLAALPDLQGVIEIGRAHV